MDIGNGALGIGHWEKSTLSPHSPFPIPYSLFPIPYSLQITKNVMPVIAEFS